jgi:hypothetical protein
LKKFINISILVLCIAICDAQTLKVTSDKNPAIIGEQILIKYSVNAKAKNFIGPTFTGFKLLSGPNSSSSSSYSFVNGKSKSEVTTTYSYYLTPLKEGTLIIPSATVFVNDKEIISEPVSIKILKANNQQKQKSSSISDNLYISVKSSKRNITVGEQIIVTYKLHTRLDLENTELSSLPNLNGFWKKDLETSSRFKREVINGVAYNTAVIKKSVLTAQKSGELIIDPMQVSCRIRIANQNNRRDPFASFFNSYNTREEIISSKSLKINVKELPNPKPKGFFGAVGNFKISSEIDKSELKANDAITLKIKLTGTGNIELIEPFKINYPDDFEVYDPKISDKIFEGGNKRSIKNFEYLLIPRFKGNYEIPAYEFISYNPKTKKYVNQKTKKHSIKVLESDNNEGSTTTFSQQKIEPSKKDINYIKTTSLFLKKNNKKDNNLLYYILFFLPILIIIFNKTYKILSSGKSNSLIDYKHKAARKIANKKLKKAKEYIKENNYENFFEEIEKSLWGYFADKFKVEIIHLTKESIEEYFNKNEISVEAKEKFISLINECEIARYAPSSNKNQKMTSILEEAEKIIVNVEANLK